MITDDKASGSKNKSPDASLETFAVNAIAELVEHGICTEYDDGSLDSTAFGDIMAKFGCSYATVKTLLALPSRASTRQLLEALSSANEFENYRFRQGEKPAFAKVNKTLLYPLPKLQTSADKVGFMIQFTLEGHSLADVEVANANLTSELYAIWPIATRAAKTMVDIQLQRKDDAVRQGLELLRALNGRAWDNSHSIFRQIPGIGEKGCRTLYDAGITSFAALAQSDYHRINQLLNVGPSKAKMMLIDARGFPFFGIHAEIEQEEVVKSGVRVSVRIEVELLNADTVKIDKDKRQSASIVTTTSDGLFVE